MESPWVRSGIALMIGAVLVGAGVPYLGWFTTLPLGAAVAAMVLILMLGPHRERTLAASITAAACISLAMTVIARATGWTDAGESLWGTGEAIVLLCLVGIGVRWADGPWSWVATGLAMVAADVWLIRLVPEIGIGGLLLWACASLVAAVVGGYPRYMHHRLRRTVTAATEHQRRKFERDLHDYVAHDVSGILAQAQAAQYACPDDADALRRAMAEIEQSAERALGTMDRTMQLLRSADRTDVLAPTAEPGLADLPELLGVFTSSVGARVNMSHTGRWEDVPAEASALAYRVLVEALTNIRRHAPGCATISVSTRVERVQFVARVTNDSSHPGNATLPESLNVGVSPTSISPRSGGTGLAEAARLATSIGGTLTYGPNGEGWLVELSLPIGDEEMRKNA